MTKKLLKLVFSLAFVLLDPVIVVDPVVSIGHFAVVRLLSKKKIETENLTWEKNTPHNFHF